MVMGESDQIPRSEWVPPSVGELQAMLPQYEVSAMWGRGAMGAVYRGRQANLDRDVAIKVLARTVSDGEEDPHQFVERFKLEAKAMANLDHPAILSVHDFGETSDGQLYIVMEFVDGMDILHYLREHDGKLPEGHALAIVAHVLDALQYAHEKGVIHRDIKPANVLISNEGRVKIADFGLAKRVAEEGDALDGPLTMPDTAMGTPDFVAPEMLEEGTVADGRVDLYAVGVMLYQLLTGKLPKGNFEMPSLAVPGLDVRFDGVVSRAMEANPDSRYGSATEFRADLDEILSEPISVASDPSTAAIPVGKLIAERKGAGAQAVVVEKKSKAGMIAVALSVGMMLVGLLVWALDGEKDLTTEHTLPRPQSGSQESGAERTAKAEPADAGGRIKDTEKRRGEEVVVVPKPAPKQEPKVEPPPKPKSVVVAPTVEPKPEPIPEENQVVAVAAVPDPVSELKKEELVLKEDPALKVGELVELRERFEELKGEKIGELDANYLKAVTRGIGTAADAGDLDAVTALQGEKKRVEDKEAMPEVDAVGAADALLKLRGIYRPARAKEEGTLRGQYETALKQLEGKLTKERKFEEAKVVKGFRESLGKPTPAVVAVTVPAKPAVIESAAAGSAKATKDAPFENSLGMRFVPVPIVGGPSEGTLVLFSVWETRVRDYERFVRGERKREWRPVDFEQEEDHPAVMMSWDDAVAFCAWLTEEERKGGEIGSGEVYRLPTDYEWSCAVGIGDREDAGASPEEKHTKFKDVYPWGKQWPPSAGAGNFMGEETKRNPIPHTVFPPIEGYDDGFARTAPVGTFVANEKGLHDMAGNIYEWCDDWFDPQKRLERVQRGGCFSISQKSRLASSNRNVREPKIVHNTVGFRVVLDPGVAAPGVAAPGVTPANPVVVKKVHSPALVKAALEGKPGRLHGFGKMGNGPVGSLSKWETIDDLVEVRVIGAEGWVALRQNGDAYTHRSVPQKAFSKKIKKLANGANHVALGLFAIDTRGTAEVRALKMELGPGFERQFKNLSDLCTGWPAQNYKHLLGLTEAGNLVFWGDAYTLPGRQPPPERALTGVRAIAAYYHTYAYAALRDGSVVSWQPGGEEHAVPESVKDVVQLSAGAGNCLALTGSGEVLSWGKTGQLRLVPEDLGKCIAVRAGDRLSAARKTDGSWVAWGSGDTGLIDKIASLGPVTDLAFTSREDASYVLWIEPELE